MTCQGAGAGRRALLRVLLLAVLAGGEATASVSASPPSPVTILGRRDLVAPFLDTVPICVPEALDGSSDPIVEKAADGDWKEAHRALARWAEQNDGEPDAVAALDAILAAREATKRDARRLAEAQLEALAMRPEQRPHRTCLRIERARLLLMLDRTAEAAAQLRRAEARLSDTSEWGRARLAGIAFAKAEVLYRSGRRFEAHIAYRKIARDGGGNARLALAARLRLTDLAFDAGQLESVSLDYESLLPRASAFGATLEGWSLRAAEAPLDAGEAARALSWLERFAGSTADREARDVADIRRADLEVRLDDPLAARRRLAALALRREGDPIGVLAELRAVDLDVFEGPAARRLEILASAIEREREGLRRYALGVLLRELVKRGIDDQALAVATRLAFDGVDDRIVPDYTRVLDGLLTRVVREGDAGCATSVRALGGRYGILIERATSVAPFAQLGRCFERMELPYLAVPVYRTISRRFGAQGASDIALPLARASLASGDLALARHMADAALAEPSADAAAWGAIVAESDFQQGRTAFAAARAKTVLDATGLDLQRASLALSMARAAAKAKSIPEARFLAARLPSWLEQAAVEEPTLARVRLLEASLLTAHALRRAERHDDAFALYRSVDRHAGDGPLRSAARFWLGIARQVDESGQRAWGEDLERTLGRPWSRIAEFEVRYEKLRDVYAGVLE